jgi:predicted ATPase
MVYLKNFSLLSERQEHDILYYEETRQIYNNNYYPLHLFSQKEFKEIDFDKITIFYGGNGSGKTTLVNMIAEKLDAARRSPLSKGRMFDLYVSHCNYEMAFEPPMEIKLITSDDVFDYLLDIRSINANVNREKERLSKTYLAHKFNRDEVPFDQYDELKMTYAAQTKSMSKFVRERLANNNITEWSNGESALMFWEREIKENSIYILDEPENSLSAENQMKLKKFIEESVRFYNCQFIISTHSPFLLNLYDAKIYDLDELPVKTKKWTELPNVLVYYNFFKEHKKEFDNKEDK